MAAVFTHKNAQIAKIHIAKAQLGMDDETYRAFLMRVAGVQSSKPLTPKQLGRVLFELEKLGFKPTISKKAGRARPKLPQSRQKILAKIEALLSEAGRPFAYADGMAQQMFKRQRLEWLTDRELYKLMQALIVDANRRKRSVADESR